ncbi:murein hydrolase activator EnvC [[Haemophilus] ducreyi]|uniref:Membrane protein n=2 Tax=Haemophilus ducreyi TaxID=730 RepID=Q7VL29_HAEDU|nr:murein hydrolase activator EnvC [[Haemophilus] ducreyi]AAP96430.1 putative membrane protein [[Haemophilus] ducreyi 35000HP]ASE07078.1 hypothetical protein CEP76_05140 [[Haemophilus] ducreyi]
MIGVGDILVKVFFSFSSIVVLIMVIQSVNATELSNIQQKIQQQQTKINDQRQKRNALQVSLKSQEVEMGKIIEQLKQTEMSLKEIQDAIKRTEQDIRQLEKQEKAQQEQLKKQLDSAYRSGIQPSVLARLLSEQAKEVERMMAYYGYLNQVRIDIIHQLRHTQETLKTRRTELKQQQKEQQAQLTIQKTQEKTLKKVQMERETTLHSLDKTLAQEQNRLDALKNNEIALRAQLAKAMEDAKREDKLQQARKQKEQQQETEKQSTAKVVEQPKIPEKLIKTAQGLGMPNKQFNMPVVGKVINRFGTTQMGELTWRGTVIEANQGSPVHAIAGGRVVLADWLQGYGQVVVIDHGKDDMSLYGYNQSLMVRKGDVVALGQKIALVGNTGGQNRSALYFEIRRKGNPKNPMGWVK